MTSHQDLPIRLAEGNNASLESVGGGLGGLTAYLDSGSHDRAFFDADISILLLGEDGKVQSESDFVFYNQPTARDGAVSLRAKLSRDSNSDQSTENKSDVVTIELDGLPDEVQRVVLVASADLDQKQTFRDAEFISFRLQRTADAVDLLYFDVPPAGTDSALVLGELYRTGLSWSAKAIGRGYGGGLAAVVTEYGVEIDDHQPGPEAQPPTNNSPDRSELLDNTAPTSPLAETKLATNSGSESLDHSPDSSYQKVTMKRRVAAPKAPKAWALSIPSDSSEDRQPARLFPIAGIGTGEEQEGRATSALLAVMSLVREFGRALTVPLGAPRGTMRTFIEVPFGQDEEVYRPDGVIEVTRGSKKWTALVEVKTSSGRLDSTQIDHYIKIARSRGFDAVLTISNQLQGGDQLHPVEIDRRRLGKVLLQHLSWDEIRSVALITSRHRGLAEPIQQTVIEEFILYMNNPRSGMTGLTDMGRDWVKVRDSVKSRTARSTDKSVGEVSARFDELVQHLGFVFTGALGVDVKTLAPQEAPDHASRRQLLADLGVVFGRLKIPGAIDEIVIRADVRGDRVSAAMIVPAPKGDTRPQTRVTWLLRQLPETASPNIRIETLLAAGRSDGPVALLHQARREPACLVPADQCEIRAFRVTLDIPMGSKRAAGTGTLIGSVKKVTTNFYVEVVQNVRPWEGKRV